MNKRKVLSILLLALITVTLAVSCSGSIDTPKQEAEELAYVTFGNGHSRELGTSYETAEYSSLYWFYTAKKDDQYGTTGQVGLTNNLPTAAVSKSGDNPAKDLGGQVGPFSQGKWIFTLYAYAEKLDENGVGTGAPDKSNLIYKSDEVAVTLKGNDVKNVPVSVSPQGQYGYVRLDNVTFGWNGGNGGTAAPTGKLVFKGSNSEHDFTISREFSRDEQTGALSLSGMVPYYKYGVTPTTNTIPADFYTVTATAYLVGSASDGTTINNEGTPLFRQTFGLRVYGNATTVISGDIVEGVNTTVTFDVADQAMRVFTKNTSSQDGSTTVSVAVNPLNGNNESESSPSVEQKTTVTFPAGALADAVHQLDVSVTPIASSEQKFQVSGVANENTAVAGIDLTLVKVEANNGALTQVPVTSFGEETPDVPRKVTVTTYIATGLSSVQVKYLDSELGLVDITEVIENTTEEDTAPYYNSTTGKLVFETSHFSQFVVVADVEALNVNTGIPYATLASAIAAAGDGQRIQLKKTVNVKSPLIVDKGITLDLNNYTITGNGVRTLHFTNGSSIITGHGTVTGSATVGSSVIRVGVGDYATWSDTTSDINISLTIDSGVHITSETCYGITVMGKSNETLIVKGDISTTAPANNSYDGCAVSTNGSDKTASTIIIHEGATLSAANSNGIYMPSGNLVVYGGTITGTTGIYIKSGPSEINGGTITGTGERKDYQTYGNGGKSTGDALVVDNTDYPNGAPSVSVTGGTFTSTKAQAVGSYAKSDESSGTQLPLIKGFITGGTFSSDPSAYIADGCIVALNSESKYVVTKHDLWKDYAADNYETAVDDTNKTIIISSAEELALFANEVNNSGKANHYSGFTVKLAADINLNGKLWTPIGQTGSGQFAGTFDGQNHTISNMYINNIDESGNCSTGLFGWLNNATVKNLTIDGSNVAGHHYVGVIAGYIETENSVIESCHVKNATVSCTAVNSDANGDKCGGIVGYAGNTGTSVKNCTVSDSTISAGRDAGQVVGAAKSVNVSSCSATNVTVAANGTSTGANIRNEVIGRVL